MRGWLFVSLVNLMALAWELFVFVIDEYPLNIFGLALIPLSFLAFLLSFERWMER